MDKVKLLRYEAIFDTEIEKINPLFSKVKIRVAYTNANRNKSYISKEAFEKAIPTIYNCPIIGEFIEPIEDWGSHGGKIEISDAGIKYVHTTKAYGVIDSNSEITWEDVVEADGTINTYLCATGYLWTGRYEELETVIKEAKGQSMEIIINNGSFKTIDDEEIYAIEDFIFSGFCILGSDVEPCFPSAEITAYNFNKDEFKIEFSEMLKEIKEFTIQNQSSKEELDNIDNPMSKGGMQVDKKLELIAKYDLTVEQLDFDIEEISIEELEDRLKEFEKKEEEAEKKEETAEVSFSATYRQKREALENALDPIIERDEDGNLTYEEYYWVNDFDDEFVFVERSMWKPGNYECDYGRFTYSFDADKLEAVITSDFEEMVLTWLTLEENKKIQEERNALAEEFETLKAEYEKLKEFKSTVEAEQRKEAEEQIFSQYEESLKGEDKFDELKEKSTEYTLEELEKELALIYVKKKANFSFKESKKTIKIPVDTDGDDIEDKPYGGLHEKYLNK